MTRWKCVRDNGLTIHGVTPQRDGKQSVTHSNQSQRAGCPERQSSLWQSASCVYVCVRERCSNELQSVCVWVEAPTVMSCIVSRAVISRVIVEKQAVKMRATLSDSVEDTCTDVMDQIAALIFRLPLGSSFSPWDVSLLESHQILRGKKQKLFSGII